MPFDSSEPGLDPTADGRAWVTSRPVVYDGERQTWVVPAGFRTDLASVPRWLRGVVDSWGAYTLAALLHDWLCAIAAGLVASWSPDVGVTRADRWDVDRGAVHTSTLSGRGVWVTREEWSAVIVGGGDVSALPPYVSRRDADGLFRRVLREQGVAAPQRWLMWTAVRLGCGFRGGCTWREAATALAWAPLGVLVVVLASPSWVARTLLAALGGVEGWHRAWVRRYEQRTDRW